MLWKSVGKMIIGIGLLLRVIACQVMRSGTSSSAGAPFLSLIELHCLQLGPDFGTLTLFVSVSGPVEAISASRTFLRHRRPVLAALGRFEFQSLPLAGTRWTDGAKLTRSSERATLAIKS